MNSLDEHIEKNKQILSDPLISSQRRRHIEEELEDLEVYSENHPGEDHDPTPLELFCDKNPDAAECKIYDN
jgi:hypothetical protein